jgi:hypothetical protein
VYLKIMFRNKLKPFKYNIFLLNNFAFVHKYIV